MSSLANQPPDGGWGWMCVAGGMIINLINGGLIMVFSIIYEEIRTRFQSSALATAWVFIFNMMCRTLGGPLSTALCRRFSCRKVCLVGGIMYSAGLLMTGFPPSLEFVYFSYGLVGMGACFCVFPHLIIIGEYFEKKRSKALALASMMDGLGAFILAPVLKILFDIYGYTGTMMILSGLALNLCVAGALFRPLPEPRGKVVSTNHRNTIVSHETDNSGGPVVHLDLCIKEEAPPTLNGLTNGQRNGFIKQQSNGTQDIENTEETMKGSPRNGFVGNPREVSMPAERKWQGCFFRYCDLPLLKDVGFLGVSLIMLGFGNVLATYNTFLAGYARERGVTSVQVSILLAAMGGTIVVSKLVSGVVFDLRALRARRVHVFAGAGLLSGALTLLCPLARDLAGVYTVWLVLAFLNAWLFSQEATALFDVVGRERFPAALGLCRFLRGLGSMAGLVTGGVLRDATRRYSATFVFAGSLLFCFSLVFEVQQCVREARSMDSKLTQTPDGVTAVSSVPDVAMNGKNPSHGLQTNTDL